MVAPTVRTQCAKFYLFRLSNDDMTAAMRDVGFNMQDIPCQLPRQVGELITVDCPAGKVHSGYAR